MLDKANSYYVCNIVLASLPQVILKQIHEVALLLVFDVVSRRQKHEVTTTRIQDRDWWMTIEKSNAVWQGAALG